jgi:hypothetical protein
VTNRSKVIVSPGRFAIELELKATLAEAAKPYGLRRSHEDIVTSAAVAADWLAAKKV